MGIMGAKNEKGAGPKAFGPHRGLAGKGEPGAQFELGEMLWLGGGGAPRGLALSAARLGKAAAQGNALAPRRLAGCHLGGQGAAQGAPKVDSPSRSAAGEGGAGAATGLGRVCREGAPARKGAALSERRRQSPIAARLLAVGQGVGLAAKAFGFGRPQNARLSELRVVMGEKKGEKRDNCGPGPPRESP
jgi:TPR repeat protein